MTQNKDITLPPIDPKVTSGFGPIWRAIQRWHHGGLAIDVDAAIRGEMNRHARQAIAQDRQQRKLAHYKERVALEHKMGTEAFQEYECQQRCQGTNCHSIDGSDHSPECIWDAAVAQGWTDSHEAQAAKKAIERQQRSNTEPAPTSEHSGISSEHLQAAPNIDRPTRDQLMDAMAEIRDLFPEPVEGTDAHHYWMECIGDPLSVPKLVRELVAKQPLVDGEREAFEAWAKAPPRNWSCVRNSETGGYVHGTVLGAWNIWKARAALAQPTIKESLTVDVRKEFETAVRKSYLPGWAKDLSIKDGEYMDDRVSLMFWAWETALDYAADHSEDALDIVSSGFSSADMADQGAKAWCEGYRAAKAGFPENDSSRSSIPEKPDSCQTCSGVGIVGHSDICPDCKDTWSIKRVADVLPTIRAGLRVPPDLPVTPEEDEAWQQMEKK